MLLITLLLYSNPTVPRNLVQLIVNISAEFIHLTYTPQIKLNSKWGTEELSESIQSAISSSNKIFDKFKTERKRFLYYMDKKLMIAPVESQKKIRENKQQTVMKKYSDNTYH